MGRRDLKIFNFGEGGRISNKGEIYGQRAVNFPITDRPGSSKVGETREG